METVTIPRKEYLRLVHENKALKNTKLYKRLLEAEMNIASGKRYTRQDVGL
ncbi:hypothetical protein HOI26_00090 [Candidatus Woesearchaeota archaeon]|jgi:hypothetical protein|nr:hypothetical protein [Candidatus Woesearchaeota archaeon]MBT5739474.1 hypothetical protein [Candidatus Woesearchaeota archaeon]